MNDKLLYRIPEVAEHLSISRSKVYELLKVGRTPLSSHRQKPLGPRP
jgi:predicted DNA-binding transcriptional regulator AlpA